MKLQIRFVKNSNKHENIFYILDFQVVLTVIAYAKLNELLTVEYFKLTLSLDVTVACRLPYYAFNWSNDGNVRLYTFSCLFQLI